MILEVFISYAHQDQQFRNELDKHLSNMRRQGIISSWYDGDIAPGTEWRRQVMNHLDTAQIILLLISADFIASDFCYSIEMTRALERHRANEARVLPIILRPTDWKDAPFAALEVLPTDGKAVTRWPTLDDAFENVIQGIRRAIQEMAEQNERVARTDRIGQRFGDYWLRRRLGGGSFGDVYLGEYVRTHSLAAVKVLHVRLARSEELRAFINEVRTFRLQHPHIVRILDVGIAPDDTPFLVMEYAPNGTLRDRHPTGSRVPLSTILTYVVPIASALQYAHDLHLVHRDIKPENMLLGAEGELWLSDFGIATAAYSTASLTTEGMGGTLPYMAPEQIQGRPRPQSDQYALAIVVHEWLSGNRPFQGTPIEIAMQQQMAPPPSLRTQVPTIPEEVEQVVLTALSKDPKDRFGNVQAFATALAQAAQESLDQSLPSQRSQGTPFTIKAGGREVVVEEAVVEQQQANGFDLTESQTTDGFPSPSTENSISESFAKPGTLPASEQPGTTEDPSSPPPTAQTPPSIARMPRSSGSFRSQRLFQLSGWALVVSGVVAIVGGYLNVFRYFIHDFNNPWWRLDELLFVTLLVLSSLGLAGLQVKQSDRARPIGLIGLIMLIPGNLGLAVYHILLFSPAFIRYVYYGQYDALFNVSLLLSLVGTMLVGIEMVRAGIFPRWTAIVLILSQVARVLYFITPEASRPGWSSEVIVTAGVLTVVGVALAGCGYALLPKHKALAG